ncbi:hypothetical protein F5Y11DRAFT_365970 [Daldinia sp. FL1419]|nr:hypothetical protein F5Y11DRAFT_365970 [Daldinia sp. FL1419]
MDLPPMPCSNCGEPAKLRCSGCLTAPEYQQGDVVAVAYCNSQCQRLQWPMHKAKCQVLRKRVSLLRIAKLLKAALLTYRECAYDHPLAEVTHEQDVLQLHMDPQKRPYYPWYKPFPSDLDISPEDKEVALTSSQCTTAQCLLGPLARYLLEGLASKSKTIEVNVVPKVPWNMVWHNYLGKERVDFPSTITTHAIVLVWLGNEGWVVDVTGCQFGFQDVLIPIDKYFYDTVQDVVCGPFPYVETETTDVDAIDKKLSPTYTDQQRLKVAHERAARHHFAKFALDQFGHYKSTRPSKDFLNGTSKEFQTKLARFENDLKVHMTSFVDLASGKENLDEFD